MPTSEDSVTRRTISHFIAPRGAVHVFFFLSSFMAVAVPARASVVAPCTDFYAHVCAARTKDVSLPAGRSVFQIAFESAGSEIKTKRKAQIESFKSDGTAQGKMISAFIFACTDASARTREEKALIDSEVRFAKSAVSADALRVEMGKNIGTGKPALFKGIEAYNNLKDPGRKDLFLYPVLAMHDTERAKDKTARKDFQGVLRAFYKELGYKDDAAAARFVVKYEDALAKAYPDPAAFDALYYKPSELKRAHLLKTLSAFYLKTFLERVPKKTVLRDMTGHALSTAHAVLARATKRELEALYLHRAIFDRVSFALPTFVSARRAFESKHLGAAKDEAPLAERCLDDAKRLFVKDIDAALMAQMDIKDTEARVKVLFDRIRAAYEKSISANKALSPATRNAALRKLKGLRVQLVKPAREEDWGRLSPLNLSPTLHLENTRRLAQASVDALVADLGRPVNFSKWDISPLEINAAYDPNMNLFVLPLGILRPPFFNPSGTDEENLGAIGVVIGHELGHAFDDVGALYDEKGVHAPWMTKKDQKAYEAFAQRVEKRYARAGANGKLTLGESLADQMGLKSAWQALNAEKPADPAAARAFFSAFAQVHCAVSTPEARSDALKGSVHPPGDLRVNLQVGMMNGFRETFGCKANDPMVRGAKGEGGFW